MTIEFIEEVNPSALDSAPYDPYLYDKTTEGYAHVDTMQTLSKVDAAGSDPFIGGLEVPLLLVIDNVSWVPPVEQEPIWSKYMRFDDWVYSDFTSYTDWYDL